MIKVQSASDFPVKECCKCGSCGKPVKDDKDSIYVDIAHDFYYSFFLLCGSCRLELHEKI